MRNLLFIAEKRFQLQVRHKKQLIEKGPRDLIILGDFRHFPVDTLMEPRQHDNMDTGLGTQIWASRKLHPLTSGCWWMSMNLKVSMLDSTIYTTRGFLKTVNWDLKGVQNSLVKPPISTYLVATAFPLYSVFYLPSPVSRLPGAERQGGFELFVFFRVLRDPSRLFSRPSRFSIRIPL